MKKMIRYCVLGNCPAIDVEYEDGRAYGFEHRGDKWHSISAADSFTKGQELGKGSFDKLFPDIGLPVLPE